MLAADSKNMGTGRSNSIVFLLPSFLYIICVDTVVKKSRAIDGSPGTDACH